MSRSKEAFMEQQRAEECARDAAPEMLAALREIMQLAGRDGPPNEIDACNEIERVASATIRKATGAA